ncbi:MAG: hypothetical protein LBM73_00900 [Candidatus Nomurabacteria bacterium]|jgi:hypothetical protein|nr:hypothetical protein [Candidatus Nomurabacteria bacterium]
MTKNIYDTTNAKEAGSSKKSDKPEPSLAAGLFKEALCGFNALTDIGSHKEHLRKIKVIAGDALRDYGLTGERANSRFVNAPTKLAVLANYVVILAMTGLHNPAIAFDLPGNRDAWLRRQAHTGLALSNRERKTDDLSSGRPIESAETDSYIATIKPQIEEMIKALGNVVITPQRHFREPAQS